MDSGALKELIEKLLALLEVEVDSVVVQGTHRTVVAITSPEGDKLIGQDGETLRAFTMIAKRLAEAKHGAKGAAEPATFIIDVNGKQEAQLNGVRTAALLAAQRVRLFKTEAALEPMTAYERLVVHELFANDEEIATESAGEAKLRHIVLKYKK